MRYNSSCHADQNTGVLCFTEAAHFPQSDIVGKVPFANGFRFALADPRDNGSAIREGHFAMNLIYLYIYRHRESGKAYIGVTGDPEQRFRKHNNGESASLAFNRAVKKYGIESFDFQILAIFDDVEAANYHENAAIAAFGTLSPYGYNLIGGAPKSKYFGPMSQEVKDKIGLANRKNILSKEHLQKMLDARKGKPNHNAGKTFSQEYRAKLSAAHKGVPLSAEHRANMIAAHRTPEARAKASAAIKGKSWSKARREAYEKKED